MQAEAQERARLEKIRYSRELEEAARLEAERQEEKEFKRRESANLKIL
jgi:hypothetical protein